MEENPVHYRIHVYAPNSAPPDEPIATTLCPDGRELRQTRLAQSVPLVTCRRCLQLLDVIGLRPIM